MATAAAAEADRAARQQGRRKSGASDPTAQPASDSASAPDGRRSGSGSGGADAGYESGGVRDRAHSGTIDRDTAAGSGSDSGTAGSSGGSRSSGGSSGSSTGDSSSPSAAPGGEEEPKSTKGSVSVGASSAVSRSLVGQLLALWFRVPVKLFRPTRVDFMLLPRALHGGAAGEATAAAATAGASTAASTASAGGAGGAVAKTSASATSAASAAGSRIKTGANRAVQGVGEIAAYAIPTQFQAPPVAVSAAHAVTGNANAVEAVGAAGLRAWRSYVSQSGPVVLARTIRAQGWKFVPDYILPPLLANSLIGVVLYTTYIETLGLLHPPSRKNPNDPRPPPPFATTFQAGAVAGLAQSIVSQPVDALKVRFEVGRMLHGEYRSLWHYAATTVQQVGVKPLFGGFALGATKELWAMGVFFATFETVKNQWQNKVLAILYGTYHLPLLGPMQVLRGEREHRAVRRSGLYSQHDGVHADDNWRYGDNDAQIREAAEGGKHGARHDASPSAQRKSIRVADIDGNTGKIGGGGVDDRLRPHWIFAPAFLLLAGLSASFAHTAVYYPLSKVQAVHLTRLECVDYRDRYDAAFRRSAAAKVYWREYKRTLQECGRKAKAHGGWTKWLGRGFLNTAVRSSPSTAVGLIIFELFRTHLIEG